MNREELRIAPPPAKAGIKKGCEFVEIKKKQKE